MEEAAIAFTVRLANAVLWTVWAYQTFKRDVPLVRLARQMVLPVIMVGMWILVLGGAVSLQLVTGDIARTVYTLYTAFAATVAGTLVVNNVLDDRSARREQPRVSSKGERSPND